MTELYKPLNNDGIHDPTIAFAWDGERLAVVDQGVKYYEEEYGQYAWDYDSCGFELHIYDKTGLLYLGYVDTSLSSPNVVTGSYRRPSIFKPFEASWN